MTSYRLGILNSHPIQYFAPLYRRLADHPAIDLTVFFCSRKGVESYADEGFGGVEIEWDRPLLQGYDYRFLENLAEAREEAWDFWSLVNPGIVDEVRALDALVIHGHNFATYLLAVAAARIHDTALLMRCDAHLGTASSRGKQMLRRPALGGLYGLFDGFLAIGTKNVEYYRAMGVPKQDIYFAPFSVDNDFFRSRQLDADEATGFRREHGLDPNRPVILFASKMTPGKRGMDLVRAYERIRRRGVEAQLVMAGDGFEREAMQQYVADRDIPDVSFPGFVNQSELPRWYSVADIFVLPTENDAWGLVLNEVMTASVPVVSTWGAGASYDLIHEKETGFVYDAGNVDALSDVLEKLATDQQKLQKMGEAARELIDEWGLEATVDGYVKAVRGVVCG